MTSPPKPQTTQSQDEADSKNVSPTADPDEPSNGSNAVPDARKATESRTYDAPESAGFNSGVDTKPNPSKGVEAIVSILLTQTRQASKGAEDPSLATQASGSSVSQPSHGSVISAGAQQDEAFTGSSSLYLDHDSARPAGGHTSNDIDQTLDAEPDKYFVNDDPQHGPIPERPSPAHGIFTVAGEQHTAVRQANGVVEIDGESYAIGAVATVDGSPVTFIPEGLIVGPTLVPFAESPASNKQGAVFSFNGHTYSVDSQSGSLLVNGAPASVGQKITTNGDVFTVGSHAINVEGTTIPFAGGQPAEPTPTAYADIVISGKTIAALKDGDHVLLSGTTLTMGQVTTISGTQVSVASNRIVVGSSTAAFHQVASSSAKASDAVTVDGTVYPVSTMADPSDAVIAGNTLSRGGPAATIHGQVITKGSDGVSVVDSRASPTTDAAVHGLDSVVIIDGTAYTATPVSGKSGAVALKGETLSIGGPGATIAGHYITQGRGGISIVDPTSSASSSISTSSASGSISGSTASSSSSGSSSSTDPAESSMVQESSMVPSDESSAASLEYGSGATRVWMALTVLLLMFIDL